MSKKLILPRTGGFTATSSEKSKCKTNKLEKVVSPRLTILTNNSPSPGHSLGDFTVVEEIGSGANGTVFKVRSAIDSKIYVAKKITLKTMSQKEIHKVQSEVEIMKRIEHPHIIRFFSSFIEESSLYIIMEYAEGGDLYQLYKTQKVKGRAFPEILLWRLLFEMSLAISYLHSNKIIHRDLKSLNVFLTKDRRIKIGDLGMSRILDHEDALVRSHVGTPAYLSPEQIKRKPYSYKVDIWGIGCLLYTLCALGPPFAADNIYTLSQAIINDTPKPLPKHYSQQLDELIMRMLSKDPVSRPSIEQVLEGIPRKIKSAIIQQSARLGFGATDSQQHFTADPITDDTPLHNEQSQPLTPTQPHHRDAATPLDTKRTEFNNVHTAPRPRSASYVSGRRNRPTPVQRPTSAAEFLKNGPLFSNPSSRLNDQSADSNQRFGQTIEPDVVTDVYKHQDDDNLNLHFLESERTPNATDSRTVEEQAIGTSDCAVGNEHSRCTITIASQNHNRPPSIDVARIDQFTASTTSTVTPVSSSHSQRVCFERRNRTTWISPLLLGRKGGSSSMVLQSVESVESVNTPTGSDSINSQRSLFSDKRKQQFELQTPKPALVSSSATGSIISLQSNESVRTITVEQRSSISHKATSSLSLIRPMTPSRPTVYNSVPVTWNSSTLSQHQPLTSRETAGDGNTGGNERYIPISGSVSTRTKVSSKPNGSSVGSYESTSNVSRPSTSIHLRSASSPIASAKVSSTRLLRPKSAKTGNGSYGQKHTDHWTTLACGSSNSNGSSKYSNIDVVPRQHVLR